MIRWRDVFAAVAGLLILAAAVHADMMPMPPPTTDAVIVPTRASHPGVSGPALDNLHWPPVPFSPSMPGCVEPVGEIQSPQLVPEEQRNARLYMYGLFSLALFRYARLARKFSFRSIPDWDHCDGPFPIGPSETPLPDYRRCAAIHCFPPADGSTEEYLPRYDDATTAALWRKAQATSVTLAPRGPPCLGD